jgi:thiamine biosynthesis lipoprotein
MEKKPLLLFLLAVGLISSFYSFKNENKPKNITINGASMGTFYRIIIATQKKHDLAYVNHLSKIIKNRLDDLDQQMSTFKPTSLISLFNNQKNLEKFFVTKEIIKVVSLAHEIYNLSGHAFNIALDPLIDLWGFDKSARRQQTPSQEEIKHVLSNTELSGLIIGDNFLQKTNPNLSINLSGIAKGFVVDEIAVLLKKQELNNFLIEIGGEIVASGQNFNKPWVIGIEDHDNIGEFSETIELTNQAIASSGNYINYFTDSQGNRYTHIINPNTGYPLKSAPSRISILAPTCMLADGLATACMLLDKLSCGNLVGKFTNTKLLSN